MKKPTDYQLLKEKFIEMYGFVCACCGEANPAFLTLDHVNNDGKEHRETTTHVLEGQKGFRSVRFSTKGSGQCLRDAVAEHRPDLYQIFCYNCNFGRAHDTRGTCPHNRECADLKAYRRGRNRK